MFGLTVWEVVGCLVCAALFLYLLPYIVGLLLLIIGIICGVVGGLFKFIGNIINEILGGK